MAALEFLSLTFDHRLMDPGPDDCFMDHLA